jgi:hypothetical protein
MSACPGGEILLTLAAETFPPSCVSRLRRRSEIETLSIAAGESERGPASAKAPTCPSDDSRDLDGVSLGERRRRIF